MASSDEEIEMTIDNPLRERFGSWREDDFYDPEDSQNEKDSLAHVTWLVSRSKLLQRYEGLPSMQQSMMAAKETAEEASLYYSLMYENLDDFPPEAPPPVEEVIAEAKEERKKEKKKERKRKREEEKKKKKNEDATAVKA